jgi:hypothetical protein
MRRKGATQPTIHGVNRLDNGMDRAMHGTDREKNGVNLATHDVDRLMHE